MGEIALDRSGNLNARVFYRFHVPFDDGTDGLHSTPGWIIVPRTPTDDALEAKGEGTWMWASIGFEEDTRVVARRCAADFAHVTHSYSTKFTAEGFGGKRVSPFIPTNALDSCFILSEDMRTRVEALKPTGAKVNSLSIIEHVSQRKLRGFATLQFIGHIIRRMPKIVGAPNLCPFCGKAKIGCESCGHWNPYCPVCRKDVATLKETHEGKEDKRLSIEEDPWRVLEGKTWDGSDLVQAHGRNFASKRFIDWLLRIHAAPFYAEPVWFCVDGMSDQQKQWFEELKKPLES